MTVNECHKHIRGLMSENFLVSAPSRQNSMDIPDQVISFLISQKLIDKLKIIDIQADQGQAPRLCPAYLLLRLHLEFGKGVTAGDLIRIEAVHELGLSPFLILQNINQDSHENQHHKHTQQIRPPQHRVHLAVQHTGRCHGEQIPVIDGQRPVVHVLNPFIHESDASILPILKIHLHPVRNRLILPVFRFHGRKNILHIGVTVGISGIHDAVALFIYDIRISASSEGGHLQLPAHLVDIIGAKQNRRHLSIMIDRHRIYMDRFTPLPVHQGIGHTVFSRQSLSVIRTVGQIHMYMIRGICRSIRSDDPHPLKTILLRGGGQHGSGLLIIVHSVKTDAARNLGQ